jgi:hypothetical protein
MGDRDYARRSAWRRCTLLNNLIIFDCHKDEENKVSQHKIASAIMLGASLHILIVLVFGHFFLEIPVSETIKTGFGDERLAWIMVFTAIDAGV